MVDLTASADFFRRFAIWIVVTILGLIVIIALYMNRTAIQNAIFPPKPLPATVAFGILPKFNLESDNKPAGGITYTLQTISGGLPSLPNKAKVFAIAQNQPASFSAPKDAKRKARELGFGEEPIVSGTGMTFTDANGRTLITDVISGDMNLTSDYLNDPGVLTSRPASVEAAKSLAQTFLRSAGINFPVYPEEKVTTKFLRLDGGQLTTANSLSEANLIEFNYVMNDLDKIPVYVKDRENNLVSAIVSKDKVVEAKFQPLKIERGLFATYPLKNVETAFADLKSGNAVINKPLTSGNQTITSVDLGYVIDGSQNYLVPVYVFELGSGALAFVPAVESAWIQQ